jgi:hypothetical protein
MEGALIDDGGSVQMSHTHPKCQKILDGHHLSKAGAKRESDVRTD